MQQLKSFQEIESAVNEHGEIVISKNSKNNVIIMSMEEYKKKLLDKDIQKHLIKAEADIKEGRVRNAREVFKEWKEKYGRNYIDDLL